MKITFKIIFSVCLVFILALSVAACKETPLPCEHVWGAWATTTLPTCEEVGVRERHCTKCDVTENRTMDAIGHIATVDKAVAPTCTEAGLTEGKKCANCDKVLVAQTEIPALGLEHSYNTSFVEPTANEVGGTKHKCYKCEHYYFTDTIMPAEFTITEHNRTKIGYTGEEGEELIIPAVFQEDGVWYRVTCIGMGAFRYCGELTSVTIPESVTEIGIQAFLLCTSLKSVTLFEGLEDISISAFDLCRSLESIRIPASVKSVHSTSFTGCRSLTSIKIADDNPVYYSEGNCIIERISKTLILGCKVSTIPQGVTSIAESAFASCDQLTAITIPDSVTSIGNDAFSTCRYLKSVVLPKDIVSIEPSVFWGCSSLESITIPSFVTNIGSSAFFACSSLKSVTMPDGITSIGVTAFQGCASLTRVTLPKGITTIEAGLFGGCVNLASIVIPEAVTSIGKDAFKDCNRLLEIYNLSPSLTITKGSIDNDYLAYRALHVSTSMGEPSQIFVDENGYVFFNDADRCLLVANATSDLVLTLPETHKGKNYDIYSIAFRGKDRITDVTIPNGVTRIGAGAFEDCHFLTDVKIPRSVTSIGEYAFHDCTRLKNITFGGTKQEWNAIEKDFGWDAYIREYTVYCTDGSIYCTDGTV